ncbi:hypothetical protein, partial [Escherichia coli]|uniref:hypothetical protein n=1 Tax=Escherichia coli TaxID=562 RepID=UPI003D7916E4
MLNYENLDDKFSVFRNSLPLKIRFQPLRISNKLVRIVDDTPEIFAIRVPTIMLYIDGFAPIFPDICYHLTHYKPAAADIPV